ncbi:MAG: hypothetical protein M0Z81_08165 [Deltaproteobacteria bacterium]|nr:hypothetical protein [Deltaproteobacteria bacterium]
MERFASRQTQQSCQQTIQGTSVLYRPSDTQLRERRINFDMDKRASGRIQKKQITVT